MSEVMENQRIVMVVLVLGLVVQFGGVVEGQVRPERLGLKPVDQRVDDVGLLNRSLRKREAGLGIHGQDSFIFRRARDVQGGAFDLGRKFYVIRQGMTAVIDQGQYTEFENRRTGQRVTIADIPANTVFLIGGVPDQKPEVVLPDHPQLVKRRVGGDYRGIGRYGFGERVDGRVAEGRAKRMAAWRMYFSMENRGRQAVLNGIDEAVAKDLSGTVLVPIRR